MRKTLFTFVFAFALGVFSTIWLLSPGDVKGFMEKVTKDGSFNINQARESVDWNVAEERVISGVTKTVDKVSEWELFNSIRARQYVNNNVQ